MKQGIIGFALGVATLLIGSHIWLQQPAQEMIRTHLEFGLREIKGSSDYVPGAGGTLINAVDHFERASTYEAPGTLLKLLPAAPASSLSRADIARTCVQIWSHLPMIELEAWLTPEAWTRLQTQLEATFDAAGVSAPYLLVTLDNKSIGTLQASARTFRELAREQARDDRLPDITFSFDTRQSYWIYEYLAAFTKGGVLQNCIAGEDVTPVAQVLKKYGAEDLIDSYSNAAAIRAGLDGSD